MTLSAVIPAQNTPINAADMRELLRTFPATGVLEDGHLKVSQRGAGVNMSVDVSAGYVVVANAVTSRGKYLLHSDAVENVPLDASPGAGSSRIDLIVAAVQDQQYGDPADAWGITKVTGVASSTPTAPALPAGSVLLATVAIGSGVASIANGNITDRRAYAPAITYTNRLPVDAVNGQVVISSTGLVSLRANGAWSRTVVGAQFKANSVPIPRALPTTGGFGMLPFGPEVIGTVPAGTVNVTAIFTGDAYYTGSSAARGQVAVEISLDGGTTWDTGATSGGACENITAGTDPDMALTAAHARSGVSTGGVRARVVALRDGAVFWYLAGGLSLQVTPG